MQTIKEFWVDTDQCTAHYLCIELVPIRFEMSGNGWSVSIRGRECAELNPDEVSEIMWAAAHCPTAAIKVELVTGETVDSASETLKALAKRV
ncbi:hypothetical protein GM658_01180 [Pseudoduganella eburnea]|uniref:Ferredoxin n=1 Tax=Massilia eburnea TaxID=1776165 RepID=A0A6L6Q9Z3_9BURK|nr:hypothetical protein [Massilia eburnea]